MSQKSNSSSMPYSLRHMLYEAAVTALAHAESTKDEIRMFEHQLQLTIMSELYKISELDSFMAHENAEFIVFGPV